MPLIPVSDNNEIEAFYQVPYQIYHDDPNWIPPLQEDLAFIFDPEQNPAFQDGDLQRWVLLDGYDTPIGRIAAFTKGSQGEHEAYEVGGMGFFECIEDQESAFTLFEQAQTWLAGKGVQAMDGPINFGERDRFWGLLVDGFDKPSYQENYHPSYYQTFFENYGFQPYYRQETYVVKKGHFDSSRLRKIAQRSISDKTYHVETLRFNRADRFAEDFIQVYNEAWANFQGFQPLTKPQVKGLLEQVKPIIEKEFLIFVYDGDQPAGILFLLPDVNQIFQYFDGKMGLLEKLQFLYHRNMQTMDKLKGVVMGVHPDYQNQGVDAMLIDNLVQNVESQRQYHIAELSWIGDFNPKMKALMKKLNARLSKVHITYRKLFDDSLPLEPYRIQND